MQKERKPLSKSAMKRAGSGVMQFLGDSLRVSALSKHESFVEEEEWRLVLGLAPLVSSDEFTRQFRPKSTMLAPYTAYPLGTTSNPLPLTDVILGPGSDENAVYSTEMFLRQRGLKARVRLSKAPYRVW
jgi:hypothetical protein